MIVDWARSFAVNSASKTASSIFTASNTGSPLNSMAASTAQIDQMRKDAAKEDYLRTLGIGLLRIPNAMVLEHPDEFVREVVQAMGRVADKAKK